MGFEDFGTWLMAMLENGSKTLPPLPNICAIAAKMFGRVVAAAQANAERRILGEGGSEDAGV